MQDYSGGKSLNILNILSAIHRFDPKMRSMNQLMTNEGDVNCGRVDFGHWNLGMEAEIA